MRIRLAILLALAACGGAHKPTVAPPVAPGNSGLPGLDWGDDVAKVTAQYPDAKPDDAGMTATTTLGGEPATISLDTNGNGLMAATITRTATFPSMDECLKVWTPLRAKLDATRGASQSENGAAYWSVTAANIELSCNPDDSGAAQLSESYAPLEGE